MAITASTTKLYVVLLMSIFLGIGAASSTIGLRSTVQTELPRDMLGRVFTTVSFLISTLRMLSIGFTSVLANLINLRLIYLFSAILIIFAGSIASVLDFNLNDKKQNSVGIQ